MALDCGCTLCIFGSCFVICRDQECWGDSVIWKYRVLERLHEFNHVVVDVSYANSREDIDQFCVGLSEDVFQFNGFVYERRPHGAFKTPFDRRAFKGLDWTKLVQISNKYDLNSTERFVTSSNESSEFFGL